MDIARLRAMADQIGRNFAVQGHDRAVAATAEHIALFWDPRMKAALLAADRASFSPIAAEAIARLEHDHAASTERSE